MNTHRGIIKGVVIGVLIGGFVAAGTVVAKVSLHGKFSANTYIAGENISYKTPEEALELIGPALQKYRETPIQLTFLNRQISALPQELGLSILPEETLNLIEKTDARSLNPISLLPLKSNAKKSLGFLVDLDQEKLDQRLEQELKLSEIGPKSATFYFEGNSLQISEHKDGLVVEREQLIKDLKNSAKALKSSTITINTQERKAHISKEALEAERPRIEEQLKRTITLEDPVYSDDWDIQLEDHLDWVSFTYAREIDLPLLGTLTLENSNQGEIKISIKQEALNQFIDEEISKWLDKEAENVRIYHNDEGKIAIEGMGKDGLKIQRPQLKQAIELALENNVASFTIPTVRIPAEFNIAQEIKAMGITERIAQGHTSYYGSPANRVHNIKVGSSRFDGLIIQPGEEFSFNTNLGAVDGSTGYRKELVIKAEGTIPEYGGGICQVSTTMYRAALFGGLDITDRREHSYAVSYYSQILGDGLDATIYLGGQDLKFRNDTEHPILIHTYTDGDYELYIDLYGTSDGRSVELEGPFLANYVGPGPTQYIESDTLAPGQTKQVEKAHTGFSADWKYYLTDAEGNTTETLIETRYKAVPAKILVGTDPSIQN